MLYFGIENVYLQETRENAEKAWDEWQELLPPKQAEAYRRKWCDLYSVDKRCFDAFRSFTRDGFLQFKPYILNYFNPDCRKTNAATEGLNSLVETINASGNGYTFRHLRGQALYASQILQRISYSLDIKDVHSWDRGETDHNWMHDATFSFLMKSSKTYSFTEKVISGRIPHLNVLRENPDLAKIIDPNVVLAVSPVPALEEDGLDSYFA